jgi:hypothetical protein
MASAALIQNHGHRACSRKPQALQRAGMTLSQMDLVEVNEAFGAQYLAVEKESSSTAAKQTSTAAPSPSAPSRGQRHPPDSHLLYELKRRGKRYGLGQRLHRRRPRHCRDR